MYVLIRVDAVVPLLLIVAIMLIVMKTFDVAVAVVVAVGRCVECRLRCRATHGRSARDTLSR